MKGELLKRAAKLESQIQRDRRWLHAHAETGFDLTETAGYVAGRLREMGLTARPCGRCGWVADIGSGEDAVLLRATWMYDMPLYGAKNRGNFLVNTMGAVLQGKPLVFSSGEYRGITYVRQVVRLLDPVCTLPGGVYNYGSENPLSMLDTAKALLDALGLDASVQDAEPKRHDLRMDCGRLRSRGICFDTTAEGFARCVQDYGLRW